MTEQTKQPPKLEKTASGDIDTNSLADLLEWFLNYDAKVAIVRNRQVEELFQWKQQDDKVHGVEVYPFENAEARFAIGVFQALAEYDSEVKLQNWITEVLQALGEAKQTNEDIAKSYKLNQSESHVEQANQIPSNTENDFIYRAAGSNRSARRRRDFWAGFFRKFTARRFNRIHKIFSHEQTRKATK